MCIADGDSPKQTGERNLTSSFFSTVCIWNAQATSFFQPILGPYQRDAVNDSWSYIHVSYYPITRTIL